MNTYRVVVQGRVQRDVDSIIAWLTKRSPVGADRWAAAFESAKSLLAEDPVRYPLIDEKVRVRYVLRDTLFKTPKGKNYRAIFTIVGDEVRILRIRRPAQRPIRGRDLPKL
jgi:plasmid stabilization system protein ParE